MEDFDTFLLLVGLIAAILNVILFFKLWRACNAIQDIADKIDPKRHERNRDSGMELPQSYKDYLNSNR